MERPMWWPKNEYADVGWNEAEELCWQAFRDWLNGVNEFEFLKLKAQAEEEESVP